MAKKQKTQTFAERAQAIIKKYPRAKWDKIEQNDLVRELRALRDEQEQVRSLMEVADKANAIDAGQNVFSPGDPNFSFGPVDTAQGDPRFQKWAESVPNIGQPMNVDPSKMNLMGMQNQAYGGVMNYDGLSGNTGYLKNSMVNIAPDFSFRADKTNPLTANMDFNTWKEWVRGMDQSPVMINNPISVDPIQTSAASTPRTAPTGAAGNTAPTSNFMKPLADAFARGKANQNKPYDPMTAVGGQAPDMSETLKEVPLAPLEGALDAGPGLGSTTGGSPKFGTATISAAPQILSFASSVLGDIAQIRNLNKMRTNVDLGRMTPQTVSLREEREAATRMHQQNRNAQLRAMRDAGMRTFDTSALADQYGTQMGKSYMNEQNINAQLRQQAGQTNAQLAAQEAQLNNQLANQRVAGMSGIIDSMSSALPMALKDYRQQVMDQNMVNIMGNDYGSFVQIMQNPTLRDRLMKMFNAQQQYVLPRQYVNNQTA